MAECCYYEALRKQRVLDRAYEARCRLEAQAKTFDKAVQVGGPYSSSKKNTKKDLKSMKKKRTQEKIDAVRRDLHKQELILRDSNLVMGRISPKHELRLRQDNDN